jgi:hypothetical protein
LLFFERVQRAIRLPIIFCWLQLRRCHLNPNIFSGCYCRGAVITARYTLPDPNSPECHDHILDCIVPYPPSCAFLVIEFTQASQGLVAPDIQQHAQFLLRLKTRMTNWSPGYSGFDDITPNSSQSVSSNLNTPSHYSILIIS